MAIILNNDVSKVKHGGRQAKRISMDEFKKKLLDFIVKYNPTNKIDEATFLASSDPIDGRTNSCSLLWCLCEAIENDSTVNKDLKKIEFQHDNGTAYRIPNSDFYPDEFIGLHMTKTGLPFLGMSSCGDEEWVEVFFILYFDGTKMRGYVPYYTNTYNPNTKAAFGLDHEDEDEAFMNSIGKSGEEGSSDLDDIRCDATKLIYDIEQRIVVI